MKPPMLSCLKMAARRILLGKQTSIDIQINQCYTVFRVCCCAIIFVCTDRFHVTVSKVIDLKNALHAFASQKLPLFCSLCIVALVLFEIAAMPGLSARRNDSRVNGLDYLSASDGRSPSEADEFFQTKKKENRSKAMRNSEFRQTIEDIENDRVDIWSYFTDYVMLGDSRALDYCHYCFLSYTRVLAENGNTLDNINSHLGKLKYFQPAYVFICYGLNDVANTSKFTGEEYAEKMLKKVELIRKELPDAKIVVSSILWCTDEVVAAHPRLKRLQSFNDACKQACELNGIPYADNDELCRLYMDKLWAPDGMHLSSKFYKYWAKNLILTALMAPSDNSGRKEGVPNETN